MHAGLVPDFKDQVQSSAGQSQDLPLPLPSTYAIRTGSAADRDGLAPNFKDQVLSAVRHQELLPRPLLPDFQR